MKTAPIAPARIVFATGEPPRDAGHGGIYHPPVGALAQARHVFLQGNRLPQRWAGRAHFTVLETGFGLGNNFLATWHAWREDPQRCTRLHMVSLELHPPTRGDLLRAHAAAPLDLRPLADALIDAWPPLTPNLHALDFDGGRVSLLLALGDAVQLLPALQLQADAFYLDGFTPSLNPELWQPRVLQALARKAAPAATLATWCATSALRHGLRSAGFAVQRAAGIAGKWENTLATYAPAFEPRRPSRSAAAAAAPHRVDAIVIGAGIAGAAAAQALALQGLAVTVVDRHAEPAQETSGNPAGLFHGSVHAGDGSYARLYRAAALQAQRVYALAIRDGGVPGSASGLLRLAAAGDDLAALQALIDRQALPPDCVTAVSGQAASALAGVPLPEATAWWFYPGGGWIAPAAWARHALATPGVAFRGGCAVHGLQRDGDRWALHGADGAPVAASSTVVLANAASAAALLAPLGHARWPLHHSRGQVTFWTAADGGPGPALRMPVAGDGYALTLPGGGLLCGATHAVDDSPPGHWSSTGGGADPHTRPEDHRHNIDRLQRLTGIAAPADPGTWQGRTGWRLHADDRMPIAGAVPLARMPTGQRLDQARLLPREEGLFVITALGARGLTLAPLLARLVAAQATGTPWPLEQDLADAVDPARWLVRAARAASRPMVLEAPASGGSAHTASDVSEAPVAAR